MTVFALIGWVGFFLALVSWWRCMTWWSAQCRRWAALCDEQAAAWKLTCERLLQGNYTGKQEEPRA